MNPASTLSMVAAVVAVCAAVLHLWLFAIRRRDRRNLWLTVTAIGIAGMGVATSFLYDSHDVRHANLMQRLLFASSIPAIVGFYHFSHSYLEVDRPGIERAVSWLSPVLMLISLWPGTVFSGEVVERRIDFLDLVFLESALSGFGRVFVLIFIPLYGYVVQLYARRLRRDDPNRRVLHGMLMIWLLSFAHDSLMGLGLFESISLIAVGFTSFLVGLSSIQVRAMVMSMEAVQRDAEQLHDLIERRTEALREKDLQLAYGAQMATIGTLASNLAHEINNPIAYVSSNLNRMAESWGRPESVEEIGEMLAESQEGLGRIRGIVSSLLGLARRSDGVDEPVDLPSLIESVLPIVRREAQLRAALETSLNPVPPVSGDPRLLGHVILSLLMHALKSIPEGSPNRNHILISTRREQQRVVLTLSGSGTEVSAEWLSEAAGDRDPGQPEAGSDPFGLAATKQIVGRHGGEISVESAGSGVSIHVRLPAIPSTERLDSQATETQEPVEEFRA